MANKLPKSGPQEEGWIGRQVGAMIRRSVRARFHTVYWQPPVVPLPQPVIYVPSHHGWHDGYLLFILAAKLGTPFLDWIAEYDSFPLFGKVGGLPFPANDPVRRAQTLRTTVRRMNQEGRSLILFAESTLHRPPELLPFGRSLEWVVSKVPQAQVVPVSIVYELSMHERPEAFISLGQPTRDVANVSHELSALLAKSRANIAGGASSFEPLFEGTKDVNERWNMRDIPGRKPKKIGVEPTESKQSEQLPKGEL